MIFANVYIDDLNRRMQKPGSRNMLYMSLRGGGILRNKNRCSACGRTQKKSHDKKVRSKKPYCPKCKQYMTRSWVKNRKDQNHPVHDFKELMIP